MPSIRGTSEGSETSNLEYSTARIQICRVYFCLGIILKVILKKEVRNKSYKNRPGRSGFSSPRAFRWWSRTCRNPSGLLTNWLFVCVYWGSNPAVCLFDQTSRLSTYLDRVNLLDRTDLFYRLIQSNRSKMSIRST